MFMQLIRVHLRTVLMYVAQGFCFQRFVKSESKKLFPELGCMTDVHDDLADGELKCNCPELCDDITYRLSTSSSFWPGDGLADVMMTSYAGRSDALDAVLINGSQLWNNLLKVDVFYDELAYDVIKESEAYPVSYRAR